MERDASSTEQLEGGWPPTKKVKLEKPEDDPSPVKSDSSGFKTDEHEEDESDVDPDSDHVEQPDFRYTGLVYSLQGRLAGMQPNDGRLQAVANKLQTDRPLIPRGNQSIVGINLLAQQLVNTIIASAGNAAQIDVDNQSALTEVLARCVISEHKIVVQEAINLMQALVDLAL